MKQSVPKGLPVFSPNACPEHVEGLVQGIIAQWFNRIGIITNL